MEPVNRGDNSLTPSGYLGMREVYVVIGIVVLHVETVHEVKRNVFITDVFFQLLSAAVKPNTDEIPGDRPIYPPKSTWARPRGAPN